MRWAESITTMGEVRNAHKIFIGEPESERLFGMYRRDGRFPSKLILKIEY
jgi:hypothetical protein